MKSRPLLLILSCVFLLSACGGEPAKTPVVGGNPNGGGNNPGPVPDEKPKPEEEKAALAHLQGRWETPCRLIKLIGRNGVTKKVMGRTTFIVSEKYGRLLDDIYNESNTSCNEHQDRIVDEGDINFTNFNRAQKVFRLRFQNVDYHVKLSPSNKTQISINERGSFQLVEKPTSEKDPSYVRPEECPDFSGSWKQMLEDLHIDQLKCQYFSRISEVGVVNEYYLDKVWWKNIKDGSVARSFLTSNEMWVERKETLTGPMGTREKHFTGTKGCGQDFEKLHYFVEFFEAGTTSPTECLVYSKPTLGDKTWPEVLR